MNLQFHYIRKIIEPELLAKYPSTSSDDDDGIDECKRDFSAIERFESRVIQNGFRQRLRGGKEGL